MTSFPADESAHLPPAPPTIFVIHPRERRSKCTVEPLRGRPDFRFWKFPHTRPDDLSRYVRLGLEGSLLTVRQRDHGLLVLDGTWRLADRMAPGFSQLPVFSLLPWRTAYPRTSKLFDDPAAGLATIEAVFAACCQMGRDTRGLLDAYRWAGEFLALNQDLIERCPLTS